MSRILIVTINEGILIIGQLPVPTVGVAYSETLSAIGGVAPYAWTISTGTLPGGLSLSTDSNGDALFSGTPTGAVSGKFPFTLMAVDSTGRQATRRLNLPI